MSDRWYEDGLCFSCTRCGNCCTGAPGTVAVTDREIEGLAALTGLADGPFREVYTRTMRGGDVSLRERRDGSCIFYEPGRGCSVYGSRPRQCRTFPFWRSVVATPESWQSEAAGCPGMNRGALHPAGEIESISGEDGTLSSSIAKRRGR